MLSLFRRYEICIKILTPLLHGFFFIIIILIFLAYIINLKLNVNEDRVVRSANLAAHHMYYYI